MSATVTPQTIGDWTLVLTALIGFRRVPGSRSEDRRPERESSPERTRLLSLETRGTPRLWLGCRSRGLRRYSADRSRVAECDGHELPTGGGLRRSGRTRPSRW